MIHSPKPAVRLIGIDYGTKRIGVAVSDEGRQFAIPVSVILSSDILYAEIEKIAKEYAKAANVVF